MDFNYKKYSLENLENWMHDAMSSAEASPQEIYDVIIGVVKENYYIYKQQASQAYELLALLNGNGGWKVEDVLKEREYYEGWDNVGITSFTGPDSKEPIVCDKNDPSPECQKSWNDFWGAEDQYYPHPDQLVYTEEELNAMCERAATEELKKECIEQNREYNLREAEYYDKRAQLDADYEAIKAAGGYDYTPLPPKDKVVKWQLPVQQSGEDYYVDFPDDLLQAANLREGDTVEWVDNKNGTYTLRKITKPLRMDEC